MTMNFHWNITVLTWLPHYVYLKKTLFNHFLSSFSLPKPVTLCNAPLDNRYRLKIIITVDKNQNSITNITLLKKEINFR